MQKFGREKALMSVHTEGVGLFFVLIGWFVVLGFFLFCFVLFFFPATSVIQLFEH